MFTVTKSVEERFWSMVWPEPNTGCWLWGGAITNRGYATLSIHKKTYSAHRFSYELLRSQIPNGLILDHLCRVRWCVNPDHLECVTYQINVLRGVGFAAFNRHKKCCPKGHEYSIGNTRLYVRNGRTARHCLTCEQTRIRYDRRGRVRCVSLGT
jgi:hypothetical protein